MPLQPHGCPFCLASEVRILADFDDTLTAYRCDQCQEVFFTIALRFAAQQPIVDPLQQRGGGPLTRQPRRRHTRVPPLLAEKLASARRPQRS